MEPQKGEVMATNDYTVALPAIKEEYQALFLNLPAFRGISERELVKAARLTPGGHKIQIPNRLTAIVVLVGTRDLSDPSLQVPMKA